MLSSFIDAKGVSDVYYLENESDEVDMARQFDIDPKLYFFASIIGNEFRSLMQMLNQPERSENLGHAIVTNMLNLRPEFQGLGSREDLIDFVKELSSRLIRNVSNKTYSDELLADGRAAFEFYFGLVREYQVLCPKAVELTDSLAGTKSIVVGKIHLPYIKAALMGEVIPSPSDWSSFKKNITSKYGRAAQAFDDLLVGTI